MLQKQNAKDSKEKKDLCGQERPRMYNALRITWHHYYHLSKEQVLDKKRISHHKRVIRKLQDKLRKPLTPFIIFEAVAWGFYRLNPELFKEDVNNDLVRFDLKPNMAAELMRRDKALGIL
jgi:hypothetical protein